MFTNAAIKRLEGSPVPRVIRGQGMKDLLALTSEKRPEGSCSRVAKDYNSATDGDDDPGDALNTIDPVLSNSSVANSYQENAEQAQLSTNHNELARVMQGNIRMDR